jgi:hypothetical protein
MAALQKAAIANESRQRMTMEYHRNRQAGLKDSPASAIAGALALAAAALRKPHQPAGRAQTSTQLGMV